ncbi:putative FAD/NAD(P)-binding domain-containing protein [Seiridium cardinale]|uniref:FAD/NAD(P)-binding domain-containing protein n=1 Tax=Seiridium cardinale TaxID=138064 RepID=A0ABR2XKK7_9PEZI
MATTLRNVVVVGGSRQRKSSPAFCPQHIAFCLLSPTATFTTYSHSVPYLGTHGLVLCIVVLQQRAHRSPQPRFAVLPSYEHKAFIPYTAAFGSESSPAQHAVVQARVESLRSDRVVLDREWQGSKEIPFEYLVVASGTKLQAPGSMQDDEKSLSVKYFQEYQKRITAANSVIVVGGGAVGVQMVTDLKELYPEKEVTLVHSRNKLMPLYHEQLDGIIKERCQELGVKLVLGSRVVMPSGGLDPNATSIELQNGTKLSADVIVPAVGQTPNTQFLSGLTPSSKDSLINPVNRFIRVKPTLQFQDPKYPNIYAVGDIADSGAHKAARPGAAQAAVVAKNVLAMIEGKEPSEPIVVSPPGIHMSLGLTKNLVFMNPNTAEGETEPMIKHRDDGKRDMGIDKVWVKRGVNVTDPTQYHL